MTRREVVIVQQPQVSLFGVFFVLILALMFWKWVLFVVGTIAAIFLFAWLLRAIDQDLKAQAALIQSERQRKAAEEAALSERAVLQDRQWYAGDPRGTYGEDWYDREGYEP
jgi:hypothetical protein